MHKIINNSMNLVFPLHCRKHRYMSICVVEFQMNNKIILVIAMTSEVSVFDAMSVQKNLTKIQITFCLSTRNMSSYVDYRNHVIML